MHSAWKSPKKQKGLPSTCAKQALIPLATWILSLLLIPTQRAPVYHLLRLSQQRLAPCGALIYIISVGYEDEITV